MKKIFVFPTEDEASPFRRRSPESRIHVCGVGQSRSSAAVARIIAEERPDRIILAGLAGAYGESAAVGEVYAVEEEREAGLPDNYRVTYRAGFLPSKLPRVVSNTVSRCGAVPDGAQIENMEGASVMALCEALGVECCEIRAVSNRTGEPREMWRTNEASERLAEVLVKTFFNRYLTMMKRSSRWIFAGVSLLLAIVLLLWLSQKVEHLGLSLLIWIAVFGAGVALGRFGLRGGNADKAGDKAENQ